MKHLLAFVRLIGLAFLFTLTSLLVVLGRLFGRKGAHAMLRFGVYCKAKLLGIKSDVFGETTKQTQLILINHPSYLDIMFLNFVKHPTTLLAANNFKNWPLVAWESLECYLGQASRSQRREASVVGCQPKV